MQLAAEYWQAVCSNMRDWQNALNRKISTSDLREQYIHAHGIGLGALGEAGADLIRQFPQDWKAKLPHLADIDWSRSNVKQWRGRAMDNHGKLSKTRTSTILTANIIRRALGVPLGAEEQQIEDQLNS